MKSSTKLNFCLWFVLKVDLSLQANFFTQRHSVVVKDDNKSAAEENYLKK